MPLCFYLNIYLCCLILIIKTHSIKSQPFIENNNLNGEFSDTYGAINIRIRFGSGPYQRHNLNLDLTSQFSWTNEILYNNSFSNSTKIIKDNIQINLKKDKNIEVALCTNEFHISGPSELTIKNFPYYHIKSKEESLPMLHGYWRHRKE